MFSTLSRSIRDHASAYARGDLALDDFKDRLVGATWNVEHDHPAAADLTYDIKLLLAEHSSGDLTEWELREELAPLLASPVSAAS